MLLIGCWVENRIFYKISAEELYKKLKANGVLVRFWNKPKINDWLRITIGTDGEMKALIDGVKKILA